MNRSSPLSLFAACALFAGSAAATVTVTFTKPDDYADMPFTRDGKDTTLKHLRQHFDKLGATLPAGQDLKVEVLDVDLAGRLKPNAQATMDFRILNGGADWPMIKLRYSVESKGQVIKSGEERITDMDYMHHVNLYTVSEPLRYEKRMLDDWFKKTILSAAAK